jgi:hypothetical protein
MYVSLGDSVNIASNNIGMHFSNGLITNYSTGGVLNLIPQVNETNIVYDELNWYLISGTFTATTPAQYLTIGNFYDMTATSTSVVGNGANWNNVNARYFIDDVSVSVATGSDELNTDISLNIYPNPFAEKLNIRSNKDETYDLIIYDITSRTVIRETFKSAITLNTSQLVSGVYFYEVKSENNFIRQGKVIRD